jgi:3-hydroxyisobutyrate dehydrogenase-like beta-hydroxyacid dehydrogenase
MSASPARPNALSVAFIGFGELGQRFARDLGVRPDVAVSAYDVLFDDAATGPSRRASAANLKAAAKDSHAAVCAGAAIIISAVTADQVEAVAAVAAKSLKPGQIFLDVNSASPATKQRAASLIEASGADYVEGAVMAAVAGPGIRVEILSGGPKAAQAAEVLNAIGMNVTAVAIEHGKASAIKLCRSIMIKGLEALIVDSARASKHWDVEAEVYASLTRTFPSIDWPKLADDMAERVATHGRRRSAEMAEAADMLAEIDIDPSLARAVSDAHKRGAMP